MARRIAIWLVLALALAAVLYRSLHGVGQIEYEDELLSASGEIWGRTAAWLDASGAKFYPPKLPPIQAEDSTGRPWPNNPYTGLPMTLGSQIGQFAYYQIETAPGVDFADGYTTFAIVCFGRVGGPFQVRRVEGIPGDAMFRAVAGFTPEEFRQELAQMFPRATVRMDVGAKADTGSAQ